MVKGGGTMRAGEPFLQLYIYIGLVKNGPDTRAMLAF
jgi:hypothetical protein